MASTKISAIGMVDDGNNRKSPFWEPENVFEIQQALDKNPFDYRSRVYDEFND